MARGVGARVAVVRCVTGIRRSRCLDVETVYLVGAGPGDPGLLTVRASEVLRSADVVVRSSGVDSRVLELMRSTATVTTCDDPTLSAALLLDGARQGVRAVYVVPGDPLFLGSGAEVAQLVRDGGAPIEIVPGLTVFTAASAYAGVPLTYRDSGHRVLFLGVGGGPDNGIGAEVDRGGTVVLRAAEGRLADHLDGLAAAGVGPEVPCAVIEQGGGPGQRTVSGRLDAVRIEAGRVGMRTPALVVVGNSIGGGAGLNWYESRPMYGRRVVVTRARAQASDFVAALERLGAEVIVFPMIRIVDPRDPAPLVEAVRRIGSYDWVVLTSVNGVDRFWSVLESEGLDARALGGVKVACVGPATAAALELHGIHPDLVPGRYDAESLVEALVERGGRLGGARILLPVAAGARTVLEEGLSAHGAIVERVEAYRTEPDAAGARELRERLDAGEVDVITFTSPSTIENFVAAVGRNVGRAVVAVIGPVTAEAARRRGLPVDVVAPDHTIPGLLQALLRHYGQDP